MHETIARTGLTQLEEALPATVTEASTALTSVVKLQTLIKKTQSKWLESCHAKCDMQCSYNRISAEFSVHSAEQLKHKPSDVRVLELFADKASGIICDVGCGAGQVSRFLRDKGKDIFGMDLSEGMLKEARRLNPDIRFVQGNMRKLPVADGGWGGIVGFFALCHMARKKIPSIFQEWNRALEPGGVMMLGYHIGNGTFRRTEFYGKKVEMHCTMFMSAEMKHYLSGAGFEIEGWLDRPPYPGFENNNWRGFMLARKVDNMPPSTLWDCPRS